MSVFITIKENVAVKNNPTQCLCRRIECVDGFTLSVQASRSHYCEPRDDSGTYYKVEVGYPSKRPEPWLDWYKYAEDQDTPRDTIYAYVPIGLVYSLIQLHGGEK